MSREELFSFLESSQFPAPPPSPAVSGPSVPQKECVSMELDTHGLVTLDQEPMDVDNGDSLDGSGEKVRPCEFINFGSGACFSDIQTKGVHKGFLKGTMEKNPMFVKTQRQHMPQENIRCWWIAKSQLSFPTLITPETSSMQRPLLKKVSHLMLVLLVMAKSDESTDSVPGGDIGG